MDYSEEHLRDILELREWISEEIEKREKEIQKLKQNLSILDSLVKQSSFSKASSLMSLSDRKIQPGQQTASVIPIKTIDNKVIEVLLSPLPPDDPSFFRFQRAEQAPRSRIRGGSGESSSA